MRSEDVVGDYFLSFSRVPRDVRVENCWCVSITIHYFMSQKRMVQFLKKKIWGDFDTML